MAIGLAAIAGIAPLAAVAPVAAATNIVVNGDFELPDGQGATFPTGTPIPGWTVAYGDTDLVGPDLWNAASGKQSVDLNGSNTGGIYQDLTTTPGQSYVIRYAVAGNCYGPPDVKQMNVQWGAAGSPGAITRSVSFDCTTQTSRSQLSWTYYVDTVVAPSSGAARLEFDSTTPNSPHGPAIDDVSVTLAPGQAVPEAPFAIVLPLGGLLLGGTWLVYHRRRDSISTLR
jgi:choice-of-anchor C domain-containing protein